MHERAAVKIVPEGHVVFGLQLPIAAQSTVFVQEWEKSAGPEEIRKIAKAADRSGFFYLAVSDHVAIARTAAAAMSTTWYDAVATLGFLAAVTTRVRLLSYVWVAPYRHPLVTAKAFATLDQLSNGRVILGVGAGHLKEEFEALGVAHNRRGKLLDEAIDAVTAAFLDEYPIHEGTNWSFRDLAISPRPVQKPRPPIWVGGSTPGALRRVAERGDGWLPQGVPEMGMKAAIAFIREHRRNFRGDAPIDLGMNAPWMYLGKNDWDLPAGTLRGSAEALAIPLLAARDLGASHVGVRFRSRSCSELVDQIEQFGATVGPLLG